MPDPSVTPPVAAVLVARNNADTLEAALASIAALDYPGGVDTVIAVVRSTDSTAAIAARAAETSDRVSVISLTTPSLIVGLNEAIAAARAPVIIRVDPRSVLPADYATRAVAALQRTDAAALVGRTTVVGQTPFESAAAAAEQSRLGLAADPLRPDAEGGDLPSRDRSSGAAQGRDAQSLDVPDSELSTIDVQGGDRTSQDAQSRDSSTRERSARDSSARDSSARDSSSRDRSGRGRSGRERSDRDRIGRERSDRGRSDRNRSGRDLASSDLPSQGVSSHDLPTRDRAGRDLRGGATGERPTQSPSVQVLRRRAFIDVGLFDEEIRHGQGWEMNVRLRDAGKTVMFTPDLHDSVRPPSTLSTLTRSLFADGLWRGEFARAFPDERSLHFRRPTVIVLAVLAGFILGAGGLFGIVAGALGVASVISIVLFALLIVPIAYVLVTLVLGVSVALRHDVRTGAWFVLVLPSIQFSWGFGYLAGYLNIEGAADTVIVEFE